MELQTARLPAGHRREAGRKRLAAGHRAELQTRNTYPPPLSIRAYGVGTMRQRLDAVFGGDLAEAVRALVSESGCSQSQLEQAMAVLEEKHAEAEEYDLYDPYG